MFLAIATSMIATRAPVTTNDDCPMKIGQKCFCAVHDKHLFHISFNEAQLIGAANSLVSEINPETIDSVPKSIKIRPFLRISDFFGFFWFFWIFFFFLGGGGCFSCVFLFFCFFCFLWFAGCLGFNPLCCVGSLC